MSERDKTNSAARPRKRRRLPWLLAALALIAVVGGVGAQQYFKANDKPALLTATVELGDVEKTVTALGKLKPKDYVDVGTQVSGQLKKVHVEIGDRVEKGQLIAEIDPTVYETRVRNDKAVLENLKAQLLQQEAELALARQQLERNRRLLAARAISAETVEQNEATVKVATARVASTKAQIKAAEATLAGDEANLGYTKIYAPMAGTVVSQTTLEGQTVNANQQAPVIVQVANLDTMTVWAQVSEADVSKVKPGMSVYFTTLGMPERRWRGVVRQVQPTPEIVNDVVLYNVLVDVDNQEQLLMSSMTVQVFFVLAEARNVPVVPMGALRQSRDGDGYVARVLTPDGPQPRPVKVGVVTRTAAEVVSGLQVGDKVVLGGGQGGQAGQQGGAPRGPRMGPRL